MCWKLLVNFISDYSISRVSVSIPLYLFIQLPSLQSFLNNALLRTREQTSNSYTKIILSTQISVFIVSKTVALLISSMFWTLEALNLFIVLLQNTVASNFTCFKQLQKAFAHQKQLIFLCLSANKIWQLYFLFRPWIK